MRGMGAWLIAQFASAYGDDDERASAAEPALLDLTTLASTDSSAEVRVDAIRALQFFAAHPPLRTQLEPVLKQALADTSSDVRVTAAFGLLRLKTELAEVAIELGAALGRIEPPLSNLHQEACIALEQMGTRAAPAVPALLRLISDCDDTDLATSIVGALGAAATPEAIAALRDLDDGESSLGRAAQRALRAAAK